jgi:uncharacterized membrane protein
MTTKTRIAGITALLCICALIAVPVSAALTTDQGAGAGPMKGHGGNGPGAGLLDALAEQGYDTTALQALLDTAKSARENGDTEAAQAAMEEFREAVKNAVEETGIQVRPMDREGHGAGILDALAEQGYDTTALQALLDTAKTAHESGDTEAAQAAMEEFREAVKTAVEETGIQVGPMNGEDRGQHRAGMGPGERQNQMESA